MPELPDLTVYLEALDARVRGDTLASATIVSPFVLRTVDPPLATMFGRTVTGLRRVGKRIVIEFGTDFLVIHLMVAGRLQWHATPPKVNRRLMLALFAFSRGTLVLTEASKKKRASLHLVSGAAALEPFGRGGLEPLEMSERQFAERVRSENHTIKRTLTDPRLFAGIGNAYSDEILHRAKLSPLLLTSRMSDAEIGRLFTAVRESLAEWTTRLRTELRGEWPAKVTAFRDEMAVHGKFGKPCPDCGAPVQRIRYADNETNYCVTCQTNGKLLADRGLSRLLKSDWPKNLDELDEMMRG